MIDCSLHLVLQDQSHLVQQDLSLHRGAIWSQLAIICQKYKNQLISRILKYQQLDVGIQQDQKFTSKNKSNSDIGQVFSNLKSQISNKVSLILFRLSKSDHQIQYLKGELGLSQTNVIKQRRKNEELVQDQKSLQMLVKTYERALINKKIRTQNIHMNNDQTHRHINEKSKQKRKINLQTDSDPAELKMIRAVYNVKIQSQFEDRDLLQRNHLSCSRLASSRSSKGFLDSKFNSNTLKQMESNWNKSINLTNRKVKSIQKQNIPSMRKDQLQSSCLKQNKLCTSSVKEDSSVFYSSKKNKENQKQNETSISQFNIHKN